VLSKVLMDYAGIKAEVILACQLNKIELWSKDAYEEQMDSEPENFAFLAEEVMGNKARRGDE